MIVLKFVVVALGVAAVCAAVLWLVLAAVAGAGT